MHAPRLYLVTDRSQTGDRALRDGVAAALAGGVDAVQVREKDLPTRDLLALCIDLRGLCHRHGARLLVNDRVDVALAAKADGVHLPANSFAADDARRLLGPGALIGVSTHGVSEARAAETKGADFVVFGPLYDTPSKRGFGAPLGLEALEQVVRHVGIPVIGIGGIDPARARAVRERGAHGVAVVSSLLRAADPAARARALRAGTPSTAAGVP